MACSCPNCGLQISHGDDRVLSAETRYRCPVCRLELAFNSATKEMEPAPRPPDKSGPPPHNAA